MLLSYVPDVVSILIWIYVHFVLISILVTVIYTYGGVCLCERILHDTIANDPRSDVPVRGRSALILRFHHPFQNNEIPMPKGTRQKTPDTSH